MAYQVSALRDKMYPDLSEATKFMKQADEAKPESRDVRPLLFALKRLERANPLIGGHIQTRSTAVSAFGITVSATEKADQEKAKEAWKRIAPVAQRILEYQVQTAMYGALAIKLRWEKTVYGMTPFIERKYKPWEVERADDPRMISILSEEPTLERTSIENDPAEMWITDTDSSDDVGGILRTLLITEILRNQSIRDWHRFNKKLKGIVLGKYDTIDDDEKNVVTQAVKAIGDDMYAVTSKESVIEFQKLVDAIGKDSYKEFVALMELYAAIAITGHAHTSQLGNAGSQAALNVYQLVRQDVYYSDLKAAQNLIDQLVLHDYRMNSGKKDAIEAPWRAKINTPEEENYEANARIVQTALSVKIPLSQSDVYAKIGFKQPSKEEDKFDGSGLSVLGGGL